uniref:Sel1 repeat family protein n=1 Tax=Odontella aurita TaxID=265563 RepID=A0A7S4JMS1_9STRA|mmetsp:Transcript_49871/g.149947  ORF Transcript_49871/g.149947 Transcript_49871/m.149947 type:complete len:160 (+) Transcript_49871:523-1002(+)
MEAAELGSKAAQYQTALNYLPGGALSDICDNDDEAVLKWVKLAAENGHAEEQMTYGCKYWLEGNYGLSTNYEKAVIWMRRALARGVGDGGYPDPRGDFLSQKSFHSGLETTTMVARKLYLQVGPFPEDMDSIEAARLAADCGIFGAIDAICSIDNSGAD